MQEAPIHYNTISQMASLIEAKELSPVELTEAMLARIDAVDGRYLSYATVMADQAMESARAAETAISAGNYLGPLHGCPSRSKTCASPMESGPWAAPRYCGTTSLTSTPLW